MKDRHIPQRTCIACRKTGAKRELVRLVCDTEGGVDIDLTGKKSGRGASNITVESIDRQIKVFADWYESVGFGIEEAVFAFVPAT